MTLALLAFLGASPAHAYYTLYTAGGYPTYDWDFVDPFTDECTATWSDLFNLPGKVGLAGNDGANEYVVGATGSYYGAAWFDLYDASTHAVLGSAAISSVAASYSGEVQDAEPVYLVGRGQPCTITPYARWYVRVWTDSDPVSGFLLWAR